VIANIAPSKSLGFWNKSETRAFEGNLRGNEFEIKRIINYRNSFLPIVNGRIDTVGNTTRLTVHMRLHTVVIVSMTIWMSFVALFFVLGLLKSGNSDGRLIIPLGMLSFGYALTMGGYLFESERTKKILTEIVKGRIINNAR
jgi:hypothetical protein